MGLLDQWKGKKLEATPLLGGATQALGLLGDAGTMAIRELDKRNKAMARPFTDTSPEAQKQAIAAAMDFVGMAPVGMTAWHGSPHKFDKFDLSKIGTGEGAQAYGHGLYLAESPEVAKSYAESLSGAITGPTGDVAKYWRANGGEKAFREYAKNAGLSANEIEETAKTISGLNGGSLYKTDIPDEAVARFLDYDKLLSEQPDVLALLNNQKLLDAINARRPAEWSRRTAVPDYMTGQQFLASELGMGSGLVNESAAASAALREAGIPGIRYLDGGSRSAGAGSSNFVAFDPEMIRILERNGQPTGLMPWKPGEYGLLK